MLKARVVIFVHFFWDMKLCWSVYGGVASQFSACNCLQAPFFYFTVIKNAKERNAAPHIYESEDCVQILYGVNL